MIELSVIVPTRNRSGILKKMLDSMLDQTIGQEFFEVLVVDNASTDDTKQVVESYRDRILNLQCLYEQEPGLHRGRHRGLNAATAGILVYADDDIEAFPTWLEGIQESFADENVALVGGKNLPNYESKPPLWIRKMWNKPAGYGKKLGALSILDYGEDISVITPYDVFGCNYSIRKSILLQSGGFHPDGMPPELIRFRGDGETYVSRFISKSEFKTLYHPKASVYHLVTNARMTEEYFGNRAFSQGVSDSYSHIRHTELKETIYDDRVVKSPLQHVEGRKSPSFAAKVRHLLSVPRFFNRDRLRLSRIRKRYIEGFEFHQKEVKSDPDLLAWVLKQDYLD